MKVISVIYTNCRYPVGNSLYRAARSLKNYFFVTDYDNIKEGDFIVSPMYDTSIQVVSVLLQKPTVNGATMFYDGIALKHLQIKKLNGKEFNINNVKTENKMEKNLFLFLLMYLVITVKLLTHIVLLIKELLVLMIYLVSFILLSILIQNCTIRNH